MDTFPPFYSKGLRFTCTRCSDCCRHESGFVYLSENDLTALAFELKMQNEQFIQSFCRWVPTLSYSTADIEKLSLIEKPNLDCIFWDSGCKVYNSRPIQCRTYPFWSNIVKNKNSWEDMGETCPGINHGEFHSKKEIEEILNSQAGYAIITRKNTAGGV